MKYQVLRASCSLILIKPIGYQTSGFAFLSRLNNQDLLLVFSPVPCSVHQLSTKNQVCRGCPPTVHHPDSLAENRQKCQAHNLKVAGSNPAPQPKSKINQIFIRLRLSGVAAFFCVLQPPQCPNSIHAQSDFLVAASTQFATPTRIAFSYFLLQAFLGWQRVEARFQQNFIQTVLTRQNLIEPLVYG